MPHTQCAVAGGRPLAVCCRNPPLAPRTGTHTNTLAHTHIHTRAYTLAFSSCPLLFAGSWYTASSTGPSVAASTIRTEARCRRTATCSWRYIACRCGNRRSCLACRTGEWRGQPSTGAWRLATQFVEGPHLFYVLYARASIEARGAWPNEGRTGAMWLFICRLARALGLQSGGGAAMCLQLALLFATKRVPVSPQNGPLKTLR